MRLTAFIIASFRKTVRCSESISVSPSLRARRSAALRMPLRTKSGEVSRRFQASSLHATGESGASQMAVRAASSMTANPSSRARSSVSRLTMSATKPMAMDGDWAIFCWSRACALSDQGSGAVSCNCSSPSASTFWNSSTLTSMWPRSRATSSAICRIICRMNSGTVSSRDLASAVQGTRPAAMSPAACCRPASPPMLPIIWPLNWVRMSSVISR